MQIETAKRENHVKIFRKMAKKRFLVDTIQKN